MVEISYMPIKKIVVHDVYRHEDKDELMRRVIRPNGPSQLFWCDGILFLFFVSDSDEAKADYLKGTFHLDILYYAPMEKYTPVLEYEDEMVKGVKVRIVDFSNFDTFKGLVKWMKDRKQNT